MTAYYIDPVNGNNSNAGTSPNAPIQTPYKSGFLSGLAAGDVVRFKRGTTTSCTARIDATQSGSFGNPIVYRAYYNSDGSDDDSQPKPVLDGLGARTTLWNLGTDKAYQHIYDLAFTNWGDGSSSFGFAIANGTTGDSNSTVTGIEIRRCDFYSSVRGTQDVDTIHIFGADCKVMDCTFTDISDDAIWVKGDRCEIAYNTVTKINASGRNNADCIQLGGRSDGFWVHDNYLDGSNGSGKQCFLISGASAGVGGVIEDNILIGANNLQQCIYTDQPGTIIRRNKTLNGVYAIRANAACTIESNICISTYPQDGAIWLEVAGCTAKHNTIIWTGSAVGGTSGTASGIYSEAGEAQTIKNNILVGCGRGIRLDEGTNTESYNAFYNCTVNVKGISADPSLGTGSFSADPQFSGFMPTNSLYRAGTYLGGQDYYGNSFGPTPTIGAIQYEATRSSIARSQTSRSNSTRDTYKRKAC